MTAPHPNHQHDYDAALADIEAAYPGIRDNGSCQHGERYDACPVCSPPEDKPDGNHPHSGLMP
jgi:hypothetical protein